MTTKQSLNRASGPASEPVTLAEARDQVEVAATDTAHTTKLTRYIASAREQVESDTGYAMITQTFTLTMSEFPSDGWIHIPVRPISSITSITYYDENDSQQPLATTVYGLDQGRRAVYLKANQYWPSINGQNNGIEITFVAGYGSADNVPAALKQLVLCKVAEQFFDRGDMPGDSNRFHNAYSILRKKIATPHYP